MAPPDAGSRTALVQDGGPPFDGGAAAQDAKPVLGSACPTSVPREQTIEEAVKLERLAATCRDLAEDQLDAFQNALNALIERVAGSVGDAGTAGASSSWTAADILKATEQVQRARGEYAAFKTVHEEAADDLRSLQNQSAAARLWQEGIAITSFAAAGAGDRSIRGLGASFIRRTSPGLEFHLGADYAAPKVQSLTGSAFGIARAGLGFNSGPVSLLVQAGLALSSSRDQADAVITRLALRYREGDELGCLDWTPFGDLQLYFEPWFFLGNRDNGDFRMFSREAAALFGVALSFGGAYDRQGDKGWLEKSEDYRLRRCAR